MILNGVALILRYFTEFDRPIKSE